MKLFKGNVALLALAVSLTACENVCNDKTTVSKSQHAVHPVLFANDKCSLDDAAKGIVEACLEAVNKAEKVHLVGYASLVGPAPYNARLAHRRANAVKNAFVEHGADADKITVESKGETGEFGSDAASNRRVEIHLM